MWILMQTSQYLVWDTIKYLSIVEVSIELSSQDESTDEWIYLLTFSWSFPLYWGSFHGVWCRRRRLSESMSCVHHNIRVRSAVTLVTAQHGSVCSEFSWETLSQHLVAGKMLCSRYLRPLQVKILCVRFIISTYNCIGHSQFTSLLQFFANLCAR